jgi:hypothetical protein
MRMTPSRLVRRSTLLALGVALTLFATSVLAAAPADSTLPKRHAVESTREERAYRVALWASLLRGDMKTTYDAYGYPSTRYREAVLGRVLEKWTYIEAGKQFTFEDSRLVRTDEFNPGSLPGNIGYF